MSKLICELEHRLSKERARFEVDVLLKKLVGRGLAYHSIFDLYLAAIKDDTVSGVIVELVTS